MIHEVMVLDHGGPDLAFILYGAALKLFLFGAILSRLVLGRGDGALASGALLPRRRALRGRRRRRRVGDGAAAHRARAAILVGASVLCDVRARPPPPVTAMSSFVDLVFILVVVIDLFLLASSRLGASIHQCRDRGALLASLPLLLAGEAPPRPRRPARGRRPRHQGVPHPGSCSERSARRRSAARWSRSWASSRPWCSAAWASPSRSRSRAGCRSRIGTHAFLVPTALSTVWAGLLLVVTRKKAVSQVLGFLVLENGVYVFGLLLSDVMPVMVEAGVLLDLFAAVFVMGIVMFHINREFSSLDTEKLSALKD